MILNIKMAFVVERIKFLVVQTMVIALAPAWIALQVKHLPL
jgi:hypothetical protein